MAEDLPDRRGSPTLPEVNTDRIKSSKLCKTLSKHSFDSWKGARLKVPECGHKSCHLAPPLFIHSNNLRICRMTCVPCYFCLLKVIQYKGPGGGKIVKINLEEHVIFLQPENNHILRVGIRNTWSSSLRWNAWKAFAVAAASESSEHASCFAWAACSKPFVLYLYLECSLSQYDSLLTSKFSNKNRNVVGEITLKRHIF